VAVIALVTVFAARAQASPYEVGDFDEEDGVEVEIPYGPAGSSGSIGLTSIDRERRAAGPAVDAPCDCDAPTLARIAATAPSLASIVERAHAVAGLAASDNPVRGWRRRSRWSALIPVVSVRAGNSQSWRDILDPALLGTSSAPGSPTLNHSLSYDVRLGWRLEHLLYDPNEPRFTAFELGRRRERRKLAALASRAYFVWLRASVAVERDARWQLRVAESEAQLDALTDGWFSQELSRRESR
jgi:hypothetical protein